MPTDEHVTTFRVLVSVFAVADTRGRRTHCEGTCAHAWHRPRSTPTEVEQP
ncbi:DUF5958 family protein [Streptomyces sp. NBC_01216]|uniref:DUF5958 family protein n=1 Tax=unclassified Streptomyces TaxID=2593676 RepID=UPI002E168604|nr:DUF5958 family protein [Streptomyces sp. NBC_01216]